MKNHKSLLQQADASVQKETPNVANNHWSLLYHVAPPAYWMNDPNGFSFYKGEYHLFYQHHPYSSEWGPMHWGHVKSKDLAFWEHMPIALAPSEEYDQDGCFSGSAIEKDEKLYLMYTGNQWTGDNRDTDLKQVQCLAVSEDGIHFSKIAENPVISEAPEGNIHPYHFRDPKVWSHEGIFYCVIGSRTKDHIGQALLYRSNDLKNWEFVNVVAKGEGNAGFMWECPDLFHLDGYDVLAFSPQGVKPEGYLYHNLHQSGYIVGKLNYETGILTHGDFQLFDYGFDVYAPQTMVDDKGRRIMIAWMTMWESEMPEQQYNWAGAMTIPRQLIFKNGQIYSKPVPELEKLRRDEVAFNNVTISGEQSLAEISGDCYEMILQINAKDSSTFGLKLRVDEEGTEQTVLSYDKADRFLTLDRNQSGKGPGGIRKAPVDLIDNELHLQIFVDRSSVEVFVNGGEKVMTARIYPDKNSKGISFFADQTIELKNLIKWDLKQGVSSRQEE